MSRYRSPQPSGSKYITAAGAARLRAELDELWRRERPLVTAAVAVAAAQGDRSENAEYTYGKRRLREIDRRVRFRHDSAMAVVKSVEAVDRDFVVGVQWHAECLIDRFGQAALFSAFVEAASLSDEAAARFADVA